MKLKLPLKYIDKIDPVFLNIIQMMNNDKMKIRNQDVNLLIKTKAFEPNLCSKFLRDLPLRDVEIMHEDRAYRVTTSLSDFPEIVSYNDVEFIVLLSDIEIDEKAEPKLGVKMLKVESSMINEIGYNYINSQLFIKLHNNHIYRYELVPRKVFEEFKHSKSLGRYFGTNIKNIYKTKKLI